MVVPIIFDTDMSIDTDDVGALCVAHALEDRGESRLLAVVHGAMEKIKPCQPTPRKVHRPSSLRRHGTIRGRRRRVGHQSLLVRRLPFSTSWVLLALRT